MKNKNKNHISDIALGEFSAAFAFVLFSMVFSSASAQTSAPIPTLPVDGHTTLQTPRPDTSLLSGDYSLMDHLSWNPISSAQAAYNYARWNLLGTYSDNVNGTNYTFTKLPNDGVQAAYSDPASGADRTIANNNNGSLTSTETLNGNRFVTNYYSAEGVAMTEEYIPREGDGFVRSVNSDMSSKIATIDSGTGFTKYETYSPQGEKVGEHYLSPVCHPAGRIDRPIAICGERFHST